MAGENKEKEQDMAKEKTPKEDKKTNSSASEEAEAIRKKMQEKADEGCPFC